jgi:hypothetical protein
MKEFLEKLFSPGFMPHGYCYLWNPGLVWLHVVSDALIALAYFSIPVTLIYFIRKRRDPPLDVCELWDLYPSYTKDNFEFERKVGIERRTRYRR